MFKIGDYVAHYKEGVCEVVNIGKIDMGSSDKEYYTLKPVYDAGGTVYTPVDNKRDQIRKLITKEEAENLIRKYQLQLQRSLGDIDVLNEELTKLRNDVKTIKARNSQYRVENDKLKGRIKELESVAIIEAFEKLLA